MQLELQLSKEIAVWDDSFKYVGEFGIRIWRPNKIFKGGFHLEPHQDFVFFYPS